MLTKNFYTYMRAIMQEATPIFKMVDGSTGSYNSVQLTATGTVRPFNAMTIFNSAATGRGVSFGTGNTAPTVDDYCLEKPITSGLTVTTPSAVTYNRTAEYEEYTVTFGVTSANTVTITEIGLTCNVYWYSAADQKVILVDRTVLENPIEIPAGQAKQITYTIRFNYPKE